MESPPRPFIGLRLPIIPADLSFPFEFAIDPLRIATGERSVI